MDRCERYTDLISARLDGELTGEEERELEAHLACCPACRALESQLAAIHTAFPQVEEIPAPEGFAQGVMERIRAQESAGPKVVPLFRRPQVRALAGLAACLVLCVGLYQAGIPRRAGDAVEYVEYNVAPDSTASEGAEKLMQPGIAVASVEGLMTEEDSQDAGAAQSDAVPELQLRSTGNPAQYEVAGRAVDAVLTLTQLPEGSEEILGPETEVLPDGEGWTCYLVTWEQMEGLLALLQEQEGIASSVAAGQKSDGLCAVVLTEEP